MSLIQKIVKLIHDSQNILVTGHIYPDGDSLGCMLSLTRFLRKMGKTVQCVQDGTIPPAYRFLPGVTDIISPEQVGKPVDLVIACECPSLERMGKALTHVEQGYRMINIDHHKDNQLYGDVCWLDANAAALAELVYEIMISINPEGIDYETALCLYTGLLTDTGGFHYSNTTGKTLRISADLLEKGVDGWDVARRVYHTRPLNLTRLMGDMMANIRTVGDGKVAYAALPWELFNKYQCEPAETEGFITPVRAVEGIDIAILFQETKDEKTKISFRSMGKYDVSMLAREFGGGGHSMAAGALVNKPLCEIVDSTIQKVIQWMES